MKECPYTLLYFAQLSKALQNYASHCAASHCLTLHHVRSYKVHNKTYYATPKTLLFLLQRRLEYHTRFSHP